MSVVPPPVSLVPRGHLTIWLVVRLCGRARKFRSTWTIVRSTRLPGWSALLELAPAPPEPSTPVAIGLTKPTVAIETARTAREVAGPGRRLLALRVVG